MALLQQILDLFLHLDKHLNQAIGEFGLWTYALLFVIVFCETGLVVTPILPGDSLLFAAGALAGIQDSPLRVGWLFLVLSAAAILGDTANYWIGHFFGERLAARYPRIVKRKYLDRTHAFYERYGGETIILARFVPIVRTFAPFVAGVGHMSYGKFFTYNVVGGLLWVTLLLFGGYWFGRLPWVQRNFAVVEVAIVVLSVLPMVVEYLRYRSGAGSAADADGAAGKA
jgi:membrane-associated protein